MTQPQLTPHVCAQIYLQRRLDNQMPEPEKILRMRTVLDRTGLSRSTIYRKMREGTFPRQVEISEHCRGWRESAINRWMAEPSAYRENLDTEPFSTSSA